MKKIKLMMMLLLLFGVFGASNCVWAEKGFALNQEITDDLSTLAENGIRFSIVQKGTTNHIIAACDRGNYNNQYHYQSLDAFSTDWNTWSATKQIGYEFSLEATDTPNQYYIKCYNKETNDAYYGGGYLGWVSWTTNSTAKTSDITDHQWIVTKVAGGYTIQTTKDGNKYLKGNGDDWTGENLTASSESEVVYQFYTLKQVDYSYIFNYAGRCNLAIDADHVSTTGEVTFNPETKQVTVGETGGTLVIELGKFDFTKVTNIVNDFSTYDYLEKTNIYQGSNDKGLWSSSKTDLSVAQERRLNPINRIVYTLKEGSFTINSVTLKSENYSQPKFGDDGKAELNLDFIETTGAVTYDPVAKTITSTGAGTFYIELPNMDFTDVTAWSVSRTGDDNVGTMQIINNSSSIVTYYGSRYGSNDVQTRSPRTSITKLVWNLDVTDPTEDNYYGSPETPKVNTLSSITLTANVIKAVKANEVVLKTLPWNKVEGGTATPDWNMDKNTDTFYGNYSGDATHYADITAYSELRIYTANKTNVRLFCIKSDGSGTNPIQSSSNATWNEEEKYFSFDLSTIEKYNNMVALKAIKTHTSGAQGRVENIVVVDPDVTTSYIISGSGLMVSSATAALADESAKIIDATAVTGTGVSLESANPNCIFLASEGVLANENNVCVDGTINRLFIDETKPFALPSTATAASKAVCPRQIAAASNWGTVCLPYAIASNEYIQLYEVTSVESNVVNLIAIDEAAAGQPVIFKKKVADAVGIAFANESSSELRAAQTAAKLVGTYNQQVLTEGLDTKYAVSNNQFIQATSTLTVKAFRAYLETGAPVGANLRIIANDFESGETTGVEEFMSDGTVKVIEGYYSIGGAPVTADYPGITVVKYTDGTTQTIKK